jgi:hypothetical protein
MAPTAAAFDASLSCKQRVKTSCGPAKRHPLIGSKIIKSFDDEDGHAKWYFGTVASYDDDAKYFKVHYIDGDEEEFDEAEVHQHLAHRQRQMCSTEDEERKESGGRKNNMWIKPTQPSPMRQRLQHQRRLEARCHIVESPKSVARVPPTPTLTAPSPSASAAGKRKRSTKPIVIQDHPKQDRLPGWKLRTDSNPVLHISPVRKIPFRNCKVAMRFAQLVTAHAGDEWAAFDIIEAEYRNRKRKNGRDLIYSVVSALPRDDCRCRNNPINDDY